MLIGAVPWGALVWKNAQSVIMTGEQMEEKLAFLKALNLQDIEFFGLHMSNVLPINRQYPRDEKVLVRELDGHYAAFPETLKQAHPERGREGRVLL